MKSESVSTDLATRRAAGQLGIHSTPAPMQNPTLTDRDGPSPEKLMFLENSMRCSHAAMEPEVPSEQMRPAPTSCGIGKLIQLPETASRWAAYIVSRLSESRDVVCPLFTCFEPYLRSLKLELPNYFFHCITVSSLPWPLLSVSPIRKHERILTASLHHPSHFWCSSAATSTHPDRKKRAGTICGLFGDTGVGSS